jgi:hypothetical protein
MPSRMNRRARRCVAKSPPVTSPMGRMRKVRKVRKVYSLILWEKSKFGE